MRESNYAQMDNFSTPQEGLDILLSIVKNAYTPEEIEEVKKAYEYASEAHKDQVRLSGEPYIVHPLSVSIITARLGMDSYSVIAAMLHDTVEDTGVTPEEVEEKFGKTVAELVEGLTKIQHVNTNSESRMEGGIFLDPSQVKQQQQAENIRKMLLAMSKDIRVIIVKLADRLHNMRTLMFKPENRRREIALETIEIYAPIAHRLGIRPIKEELEDLSINYLDPVAYKDIEDSLEKQSSQRKEFLDDIQARIEERTRQIVPDAQVNGRIKSVHGIYRKMFMQNKNIDEIYDIYAVRIIVDTVIDCYNCLGIIHDMFKPIPGRFKDYISNPKANMYQSLHTTVIGKEGIPFEVQIRTWEMHRTAEFGVAAHWKYKLGMNEKSTIDDKRLAWVQQLLDSQNDSEDAEDIVSTIKSDLVPEEVFVFTPKGDVFDLPMGSTVIDFAYAIHSEVGNKMVGAKVDGRIVPLNYVVHTGEIIEVITSSQPGKGPSRDWLKIVKTSQAKSKIRQWYKRERRDENIAEGKAEVEREFKRNFIRLTPEEFEPFVSKMAERQHCKNLDDFYAAIGYGGISLQKMMPRAKEDYLKMSKLNEPSQEVKPTAKKKTKTGEGVVIEGIDNCLIKFSRCCNPLPGDEIIGFITRGHGVSIHTRNCTNVPKDITLSGEPDRWVTAYWDANIKEKDEFKCTLQIYCLDRIGMLADISGLLANAHIPITDLSTRNSKDGRVSIFITVCVNGVEHLNTIIGKLSKISGVLGIERSGI